MRSFTVPASPEKLRVQMQKAPITKGFVRQFDPLRVKVG
jgi:hypothetical protein